MPPVNKDHASAIAKKLNDPRKGMRATIDRTPKAHDLVEVHYKGARVASFGIRRSPNRNQGHGHIPKDLHLSPRQTILLAQCPLTIEQWLEILREANVIEEDAATEDEPD